jgi:hypothetical protein
MINMQYVGSGYKGTSAPTTSTANVELIPSGYTFRKFRFVATGACTVKINGGDAIYLAANEVFLNEASDVLISSFKVVEADKTYQWYGVYTS